MNGVLKSSDNMTISGSVLDLQNLDEHDDTSKQDESC